MNQAASKSMPKNLLDSPRSWYASSPRIEPRNNISLDDNRQTEDRDPVETSRELIDFFFPQDDNVRSRKLVFNGNLFPENDLKGRANIG